MNQEQLISIFTTVFKCPAEIVNDTFSRTTARNWDSIRQMMLIVEIEKSFKLTLDSEDMIAIDSFQKAREVLFKYGIAIKVA